MYILTYILDILYIVQDLYYTVQVPYVLYIL